MHDGDRGKMQLRDSDGDEMGWIDGEVMDGGRVNSFDGEASSRISESLNAQTARA